MMSDKETGNRWAAFVLHLHMHYRCAIETNSRDSWRV